MIRWWRRRQTAKLTAYLSMLVNSQVISVDEARAKMGLKPWGLDETRGPVR